MTSTSSGAASRPSRSFSEPDAERLAFLAAHLRLGGLAVIPTDTVYGIGAMANDAAAVARLLAAKGRDRQMPPPVLVAGVEQARELLELSAVQAAQLEALAEALWPGALTIVLPARTDLGWDLGETGGTLALRMPDYPAALYLLELTGPLAVTSANHTGDAPATDLRSALAAFPGRTRELTSEAVASLATEVRESLSWHGESGSRSAAEIQALASTGAELQGSQAAQEASGSASDIIWVLDGGATAGPTPSTIISLATSQPQILREGLLSAVDIEAVLATAFGESSARSEAADLAPQDRESLAPREAPAAQDASAPREVPA